MALKIRRGTQAQRLNIVPAEGELIYDTTQNKLYVGNGSTAGGTEVVGGVIGGSLGSNVNLGGYDIVGTGNINITGTITASGTITGNGDLVLGNADTDNVQFGADINSNIVPNSGTLTVGTSAKPWNTVFTENLSNDSNPVDVVSVLRMNENIIPDATGTRSVGTAASRFDEINSVNFYTQNLQLFQNNISSTVSNEDIILNTTGTGAVSLENMKSSGSIEVGSLSNSLLKIDGSRSDIDGTVDSSIKYNYNRNTGFYTILEQAVTRSYTQLSTNTPEDIDILQAPIDPLSLDNLDSFELTIKFKNTSGSQLVKLIGTIFGSTPAIKKIDEVSAGTAFITSFSSSIVDDVFTITATTNNTTSTGEITDYQIKFLAFNTIN